MSKEHTAIAGILEAMLSAEGRCEDDQPGMA